MIYGTILDRYLMRVVCVLVSLDVMHFHKLIWMLKKLNPGATVGCPFQFLILEFIITSKGKTISLKASEVGQTGQSV